MENNKLSQSFVFLNLNLFSKYLHILKLSQLQRLYSEYHHQITQLKRIIQCCHYTSRLGSQIFAFTDIIEFSEPSFMNSFKEFCKINQIKWPIFSSLVIASTIKFPNGNEQNPLIHQFIQINTYGISATGNSQMVAKRIFQNFKNMIPERTIFVSQNGYQIFKDHTNLSINTGGLNTFKQVYNILKKINQKNKSIIPKIIIDKYEKQQQFIESINLFIKSQVKILFIQQQFTIGKFDYLCQISQLKYTYINLLKSSKQQVSQQFNTLKTIHLVILSGFQKYLVQKQKYIQQIQTILNLIYQHKIIIILNLNQLEYLSSFMNTQNKIRIYYWSKEKIKQYCYFLMQQEYIKYQTMWQDDQIYNQLTSLNIIEGAFEIIPSLKQSNLYIFYTLLSKYWSNKYLIKEQQIQSIKHYCLQLILLPVQSCEYLQANLKLQELCQHIGLWMNNSIIQYYAAQQIINEVIQNNNIKQDSINQLFKKTHFLYFIKQHLIYNKKVQDQLLQIVLSTKNNILINGSLAISLLNLSQYDFSFMDLSNINIPYANLSYGNFYGTNFSGSNMVSVDFTRANCSNTIFTKTHLSNAKFQTVKSMKLVNRIICISINDTKNIFSVGTNKGQILIYNLLDLKLLYSFKFDDYISLLKFTIDGNYLLVCETARDLIVHLIDLERNIITKDGYTIGNSKVNNVDFSTNSKMMLINYGSIMKWWDLKSSKLLKSFYANGGFHRSYFNEDSKYIIYSISNQLFLREVQSGILIHKRQFLNPITLRIVVNNRILIYQKEKISILDQNFNLLKIICSNFPSYAIFSSFDFNHQFILIKIYFNTMFLIDIISLHQYKFIINQTKNIHSLAITQDNQLLIGTNQQEIKLINNYIPSIKQQTKHIFPITSIDYSFDGLLLLSGDLGGYIKIWQTNKFKCINHFEAHLQVSITGVMDALFVKQKPEIISCGFKQIKVWECSNIKNIYLLKIISTNELVYSLTILPSNDFYFSSGQNYSVLLYDLQQHQLIKTFNTQYLKNYSFNISPNQKYLSSTGQYGFITIWNYKTYTQIGKLEGHIKSVKYALFLSDSILVSCSLDKTIKIWDVDKMNLIRNLQNHKDVVYYVQFSHDKKQMVSTSGDRTIKIWDTSDFSQLITFDDHKDSVLKAIFSKNDDTITSCSSDGSIKIYNIKYLGQKLKMNRLIKCIPKQSMTKDIKLD